MLLFSVVWDIIESPLAFNSSSVSDDDVTTCQALTHLSNRIVLQAAVHTFSVVNVSLVVKGGGIEFADSCLPSAFMSHYRPSSGCRGVYCNVPKRCDLVDVVEPDNRLYEYTFTCACNRAECNRIMFVIQPESVSMDLEICDVSLV